jgi:hypothetical protein
MVPEWWATLPFFKSSPRMPLEAGQKLDKEKIGGHPNQNTVRRARNPALTIMEANLI